MTEGQAFKDLIDKLSEKAPDVILFGENKQPLPNPKKGFECQVQLLNGAAMAGVLTKTSIEGLYVLRSVLKRGDVKSGRPDIVDQYFTAKDIVGILVPLMDKPSGLVTAGGGEVVPLTPDI